MHSRHHCLGTAPIEAPDVIVRPAEAGDEAAILAGFARALEGVDPLAARRSLAEWRWRTSGHPCGARSIVAVRGGEVVGHFAGWRHRMRCGGDELWTSQAIDSFVVPEARAGLWRGGVFASLVAAYVERFCGTGEEQDRIAWGLPIERAWRLGRARAGYRRVDALWWLVAEVLTNHGTRAKGIEVREVETVPDVFGEPGAMTDDSLVRPERDRTWLAWRYRARPGVSYRLHAVSRRDELTGLCAWRCGKVGEIEGALVGTWLVAPRDEESARDLLSGVADAARSAGARRIAALVHPRAHEFALFQAAGFRVRPSRHFLVARSFDERWSLDRPGNGLELQLGDTDLA